MKKITYLLLLVIIATSCQQEDDIFEAAVQKDTIETKVDICHNGHVINVSINALQAHLNHGDKLGECSDDPNGGSTYVPDDNFEQSLIDMGYDDVLDNLVLTSNISSVEVINVSGRNISDLTGIEDFESLTTLNCYRNKLTNLDLSNNVLLRSLGCWSNQLTTLNISMNNSLTSLNCVNNQLVNLDVSNNVNLRVLFCSNNQLADLDVSNNVALLKISCSSNNLERLNVKNGNNMLMTGFNASSNSNLSCIQVDDAAYSSANWPLKDAVASYSEDCGY